MVIKNRKVILQQKLNPSIFEIINKEAFGENPLRLGSAAKPIQQLLSRSEELRVIMPSIVGSSPNDPDWQTKITEYINDFLLEIPRRGLAMEVGYVIDLGLSRTKDALKAFKATLSPANEGIKEEDWIAGCLDGTYANGKYKVKEEELYKYVTVLNPVDYINWRMCLLSAKVANKVEDVNKSVNIEFFLSSEEQIKEAKKVNVQIKNKAYTYYSELIATADQAQIDYNIITSNEITSIETFKALSYEDKCSILLELCQNNPEKLIAIKNDKQIALRSRIIMYLWYGVLRNLSNSSIIIDANDPEKILGNTVEEAISYFSNDINRAHIAELKNRYESLKS